MTKFAARHLQLDNGVKEYATKKVEKLKKFYNKVLESSIVIDYRKPLYNTEIMLTVKRQHIYGHSQESDIYVSIDRAAEKVERQLIKLKGKIQDKHHSSKSRLSEAEEEIAPSPEETPQEIEPDRDSQ